MTADVGKLAMIIKNTTEAVVNSIGICAIIIWIYVSIKNGTLWGQMGIRRDKRPIRYWIAIFSGITVISIVSKLLYTYIL